MTGRAGRRKPDRILVLLASLAGLVLTGTGLSLVGVYLFEAVLFRMGDPDQSLLFWYLPFFLAGSGLVTVGLLLLILVLPRGRIGKKE